MARANFVKSARKDILNYDGTVKIAKGESYWWWKFAYGRKQTSKTRPSRSQLTQSAFYGTLYDLEDRFDGFEGGIDDLRSMVEEVIDELGYLRDEQDEKRNNMPEGLQDAPTGELLQERYDALDSLITELEGIDFEVEVERDDEDFRDFVFEHGAENEVFNGLFNEYVENEGIDQEDEDYDPEEVRKSDGFWEYVQDNLDANDGAFDEMFEEYRADKETEIVGDLLSEVTGAEWGIG